MEATAKMKNINQGRNVRLARNWKGVTQEALAFDLNLSQKQISEIETKEKIDDALLDKIADSLRVSTEFLKTFDMGDAINTYNMYESKIELTSAENSHDSILQQGELNVTNYNYPIDDIKELYKQIIDEKDKQIVRFENQVSELKKEIEEFKSKVK